MSTLITDKVDNAAVQKEKLDTSAYLPHTPWLQFLLVCCLFALWGMAGNLNDILIAQFKKGFDLTDTQTALVQSIFFLGYFFVALPAAALIKRFSYKAAIIIGLCLYALGCFLFVPAAQIMTYGAFLACLGVIACGLSFLETSANTYSSLLGPIQSSTQRINFSQIFNSLGVISGVLIGQLMVFGENDPSHEQLLAMPAAAADVARHQMVGQVVGPYLIIGSVLVVLALVFVFIKFPSCKGAPAQQQQLPTESMGPTLKRLFAIPRFRLGILSQFLYVGAQVGVWSFTIRFVQLVQQGTSEHSATYWLLASLVIYAVGKTVATWLMNRLNPAMLLGTFALAATALLLIAVFSGSMLAVYALILVSFCMAPMVCGRTAHSALVLRTDEGEIVVPGPVHTDPMAIAAPFDLVFVAVKTTQTEAIAPWLTALCSPDTVVCVLQNGVEQRQQFAPLTGGATVLPSVVWFPAQRDADASVWLRATPRLTLPDLPGAERVQQALAGTRCAVDLAADFTTVAWRKLLQNAVAGLMVLTGRRAGMFAREDITALGLAYLRECLQVARAEGAALSENVPEEIIAGFHRAPADLSTSILIDRLNGRPLEWDIRNGVVQRRGRQHGIPTPLSDIIVPLLAAASAGPG